MPFFHPKINIFLLVMDRISTILMIMQNIIRKSLSILPIKPNYILLSYFCKKKIISCWGLIFWAWSLNKVADSEPILKTAHIIGIFKRKMAVVGGAENTFETPTGSVAVVFYRWQWASSVSDSALTFFLFSYNLNQNCE